VVLPANAKMVMSFISSLVELQLLKKITGSLFSGSASETASDTLDHMREQSILQNIENMALVFLILAVVIGLVATLWVFKDRYSW